ncbi:MAG: thioredoxin family protein, partial [Cellulomonas sp.]|nr:thioredoxin family protein [Cellulomonas sp.]
DYGAIAGYGVMRTPALVVDETLVLSGRVPTAAQVHDILAPRVA